MGGVILDKINKKNTLLKIIIKYGYEKSENIFFYMFFKIF